MEQKTQYKHDDPKAESMRERLHEIIFEADTPAGKLFDVLLIWSILLSVLAVMLESIAGIRKEYGQFLYGVEWFFTILFTIEYLLRLTCVRLPWKYATSFFGVIDLLAIVPTYLDLVLPGTRYFVVVRIFRVLRIFRILKLVQYVGEANLLLKALRASRRKITVFLFTVAAIVVIFGSTMYVVEGEKNGFTSIPKSIYWAIVTMTTVGLRRPFTANEPWSGDCRDDHDYRLRYYRRADGYCDSGDCVLQKTRRDNAIVPVLQRRRS